MMVHVHEHLKSFKWRLHDSISKCVEQSIGIWGICLGKSHNMRSLYRVFDSQVKRKILKISLGLNIEPVETLKVTTTTTTKGSSSSQLWFVCNLISRRVKRTRSEISVAFQVLRPHARPLHPCHWCNDLTTTTHSTSSSPQMLISFSKNIVWFQTFVILLLVLFQLPSNSKIDLNLIAVVFVLCWNNFSRDKEEDEGRGPTTRYQYNYSSQPWSPPKWAPTLTGCCWLMCRVCVSPQLNLSDPTIGMNTQRIEWP